MKKLSPAALPAVETFVAVLGGAEAAADARVARLAQTWESVQGQRLAAKGIGPQPIMRMALVWTDFQQTGLSMARLGDILNTRTELPMCSASSMPRLHGRVTLDGVSFRYQPDAQPGIDGLTLDVQPGQHTHESMRER